MLMTVLVLAFTLLAAVTDFRWHKIYNWTTYPGMLIALAINGLGTATGLSSQPDHPWTHWIGWIGLAESSLGFLACGFLMLVLYVFFGIGAGDVKLMAMLGAFLGLERGIEALLWTFVLGGAMGLTILIWRVGFWTLLAKLFRHVWSTLRFGHLSKPTADEREELQQPLYLAQAALAGLIVVRFTLIDRLPI